MQPDTRDELILAAAPNHMKRQKVRTLLVDLMATLRRSNPDARSTGTQGEAAIRGLWSEWHDPNRVHAWATFSIDQKDAITRLIEEQDIRGLEATVQLIDVIEGVFACRR